MLAVPWAVPWALAVTFVRSKQHVHLWLSRSIHARARAQCSPDTSPATEIGLMKRSRTAEAQRTRRVAANYGRNASDKWVRKKAWRDCDYIDGFLREFETEDAFLKFEEERREGGSYQAHYDKKPRMTVPDAQLALDESMKNAIEADGNETRVQIHNMEEGLHSRLEELETSLADQVGNSGEVVALVGELSKEKVGILNELLKKANVQQVGRTKVDKIRVLLAKLPESEVRTLLGEVKAAAPQTVSTRKKTAGAVVAKRTRSAGCATVHDSSGPQTFFHQCGAAFWICGFTPLSLEEALAEKNVLSASAGTLVRAWPLEQFLEDKDIKALGCADKELFNQIKEYRFRLKQHKNIKQNAHLSSDEMPAKVDPPHKRLRDARHSEKRLR